jgi:hypothetical protein
MRRIDFSPLTEIVQTLVIACVGIVFTFFGDDLEAHIKPKRRS